MTRSEHEILAFDVGGSYVKAGLVDVRQGVVLGDVVRRPTPPGALPEAVLDLLSEMADDLPAAMGPVGLAFPAVTKHGVAWTAANIDNRWIGMNAQGHLQARLQRPVAFLNDADAAGIAEMTLGAGAGHEGTVMMLTLGTGIGTAIFVDGKLLPNTELGHLEVQGREAEHRASARVRADRELGWDEWAEQLNLVLETYHALFWPDLFIVGGGVTENWHMFGPLLRSRAEIVPARFGNDAGIIGAAMAASQLAS